MTARTMFQFLADIISTLRNRAGALARAGAIGAALVLAGCQTELYSNVTETEANEMLAVLLSAGVEARKNPLGDERFSITVPNDQVLPALDSLKNQGLPRTQRQTLGTVFAGGGIVSSPFQERIRFIYALGEDVSKTLEEIDGVISARVHIVLPEAPELGQEVQPSSAAVFIKQRVNTDLDYLVPQIRRLVSNAIEGVGYDQVSVTLVEARPVDQRIIPASTNGDVMEIMPGLHVVRDSVPMMWRVVAIAGVLLAISVVANVVLLVLSLRARSRGSREVAVQEAA